MHGFNTDMLKTTHSFGDCSAEKKVQQPSHQSLLAESTGSK